MTPSRELDALIAKQVLGWNWNDGQVYYPGGNTEGIDRRRAKREPYYWVPKFSSSLVDAIQLVQKLKLHLGTLENGWYVANKHDWNEPKLIVVINASLTRAICLTSLKMAGVDPEILSSESESEVDA